MFGVPGEENIDVMDALLDSPIKFVVTQPIAATVLAITALVLVGPPIWRRVSVRCKVAVA